MKGTKVTRDKKGNLKSVIFTELESRNALVLTLDEKTKKPFMSWAVREDNIPHFINMLEYIMNEFKVKFFQNIHDSMVHNIDKEVEEKMKNKENLRYIG